MDEHAWRDGGNGWKSSHSSRSIGWKGEAGCCPVTKQHESRCNTVQRASGEIQWRHPEASELTALKPLWSHHEYRLKIINMHRDRKELLSKYPSRRKTNLSLLFAFIWLEDIIKKAFSLFLHIFFKMCLYEEIGFNMIPSVSHLTVSALLILSDVQRQHLDKKLKNWITISENIYISRENMPLLAWTNCSGDWNRLITVWGCSGQFE